MFSVAARPLVGASKGVLSSTKRFAGAGYVMRPQKGVLNVIDTDYDHKLGPPPVRHEVRERMYEQQMREYVKDANELGADPDPHVRKVRELFFCVSHASKINL